MKSWSIAIALCGLVCGNASGYEFDEHCRLSNDALTLAIRRAERSSPPIAAEDLARLRERARGCDGSLPSSYGEWVALVDSALSPADFHSGPRGTLSAAPVIESRL